MTQSFERHQCGAGGFIYAEADRLPREGFAPGADLAGLQHVGGQFDMAEID